MGKQQSAPNRMVPMKTAPQYCSKCGAVLPVNAGFCEQCGTAVPAREQTAPPARPPDQVLPQQAYPPAPYYPVAAGKKSFPSLLIAILGVGCLGLICVGVLVIGGYLYFQNQPEMAVNPTKAADNSSQRTPVISATLLPTETQVTPAEIPPTKQVQPSGGIDSPQETFSRWPLDYSRQWELGETDVFITDINQDHSWVIGLKKPESLVMVIPTDPSAYYPASVNIRVKVKPGDFASAGPYGVICNFQDENNYYVAEIWKNSYGIGKMLNGVFTPLTEPYWQTSQFISQVGPDGFVEVGVSCFSYSVGLEINGLGETFPVYDTGESFSGGAVALFGASSQEAVDMLMGIFYFKDLVIEPMN